MNRIDQKFLDLKKAEKKALISFITAGDPDIETTKALILEMERAGADLIELGVPFSDPIAEGPIIQEANIRALKNKINLDTIFQATKDIRKKSNVPLILLLYYNSMLHYGLDRFFSQCRECGIDGVIIPDLPYEESDEITAYTNACQIHQISMIAPTSTPERIEKIASSAKGFLYCVSSMDVTGIQENFDPELETTLSLLKPFDIPKCIGFDISMPEHIKNLKDFGDGLITGSAVVQTAANSLPEDRIKNVGDYIRALKAAF